MDKYPYDNKEELASLLNKVSENPSRCEAALNGEYLMKEMAKDPSRFSKCVMDILIEPESEVLTLKTKLTAAKALMIVFSQNVSIGIVDEINQSILKCMYSKDFNSNLKKFLLNFLAMIYRNHMYREIEQNNILFLKEKLKNNDPGDIMASLYLVQGILEESGHLKQNIPQLFSHFYEGLLYSGGLICVSLDVPSQHAKNPIELIPDLEIKLEFLRKWTETMKEFFKALGRNTIIPRDGPNVIEIVSQSEDLLKIFAIILEKKVQMMGQEIPLVSISQHQVVDRLLNQAKMNVLHCFEVILNFMTEEDENKKALETSVLLDGDKNKFFLLLRNGGVQFFLNCLAMLCKGGFKALGERLSDNCLSDCILKLLVVLKKTIRFKKPNNLFVNPRNYIIMDICLPIIAAVQFFEESPREYLSITENLEAELDFVKTSALQLIYELCEHIDGGLSCVVMYMATIINYSLTSNELSSLPEQYPHLAHHKESIFITEVEPQMRIETCLLVLASIPALVTPRLDLVSVIENLFLTHAGYFLNPQLDDLLKIRVFQLIGAYSPILMGQVNLQPERYLLFVIQNIEYDADDEDENNPKRIVSEQASKTLGEIVQDDEKDRKLTFFVEQILDGISSNLHNCKDAAYFDTLTDILRIYSDVIANNKHLVKDFVSKLTSRVQVEYEALRSKKVASRLVMNKMWNIIRVIGAEKKYVKLIDDIEEFLEPVFLTAIREDFDLEEDVLLYFNTVLKRKKELSPLAWKVFEQIPNIFEKHGGLLTVIFPTLNQMIAYGKDELRDNEKMVKSLIEIAINALNPSKNTATNADISLSALLFQVLIHYLKISEKDWENMLVVCCQFIKQAQKNFLKARFGGVILLAFQKDFKKTEECLVKHNLLGDVMDLIIKKALVFDCHSYDRTILVSTLSRFLTQENLHPTITDKMPQILRVLVSFLAYSKEIDARKAKRELIAKKGTESFELSDGIEKGVGFLKSLLYDDDGPNSDDDEEDNDNSEDRVGKCIREEEEEDEDEDEDDEEKDEKSECDDEEEKDNGNDYNWSEKEEANTYIKKLVIDLIEEDKFLIFRESLTSLKKANPEMFQLLQKSLPAKHKDLMKDIWKLQNVLVDEKKGKFKPRKIVKVRKGHYKNLAAESLNIN